MAEVGSPMTFTASLEIAQKLRVKMKASTTTTPPEIDLAGVGQRGIGTNEFLVAINKSAAINAYNKGGTLEMVANGAISVGADVFPAASGKISATVAGEAMGLAIEAATADDDIIEILPYSIDNQSTSMQGITITTTSTTDMYMIAPITGRLNRVDFSSIVALTANDTNYITWTIINMGQLGSGSTVMLAATDPNTTKATGGTGLATNTKRVLTIHGTAANLVVAQGDRIRIRATATGTLANTVTGPVYSLGFSG